MLESSSKLGSLKSVSERPWHITSSYKMLQAELVAENGRQSDFLNRHKEEEATAQFLFKIIQPDFLRAQETARVLSLLF